MEVHILEDEEMKMKSKEIRFSDEIESDIFRSSRKSKCYPINAYKALSLREIRPTSTKVPTRTYLRSLISCDLDVFKPRAIFESNIPPFTCAFSKNLYGDKYLAIADEGGAIHFWQTDNRNDYRNREILKWTAHTNAIFDLCWADNDRKVATASGDQTAKIFDVETRIPIILRGHGGSVKSIQVKYDDINLYLTAARDGHVFLWDLRCSGLSAIDGSTSHKPFREIFNAHTLSMGSTPKSKRKNDSSSSQQSVTSAVFVNDYMIASAGSVDGCVKFWDTRWIRSCPNRETVPISKLCRNGPGRTSTRAYGFTSLAIDSTRSRLIASCANNFIYVYNCSNPLQIPVGYYTSPTYDCSSFYIKAAFSPDNEYIVSGSKDNHVYIWQVNDPQRNPIMLAGHRAEVSCVAWRNSDLGQIASCSDDGTVRLWNVNQPLVESIKDNIHIQENGMELGHALDIKESRQCSALIVNEIDYFIQSQRFASSHGTPRKTLSENIEVSSIANQSSVLSHSACAPIDTSQCTLRSRSPMLKSKSTRHNLRRCRLFNSTAPNSPSMRNITSFFNRDDGL